MTTNFNLEKIFTLGQLAQYESIENNPEIEVTINKIFDGTTPLYLLCMGGEKWNIGGSLVELNNNRVDMKFAIYKDTTDLALAASGVSNMECTGMFLQSVTWTFPTDGNATEDVTLVASNKKWTAGTAPTAIGAETAARTIVRRWKFDLSSGGETSTVLPIGDGGMRPGSPLTSVTVSADLNREAIYTLGSYEVYDRSVQFPIEITCEIESLAIDGDFINIDEVSYGCVDTNSTNKLKNFPIKFALCGKDAGDKLIIDLGNKNKLTSISYGGGEAGGGNLTITYSFTTDNTLIVTPFGSYADTIACSVNQLTGEKICN
jgi:hypothetical protein